MTTDDKPAPGSAEEAMKAMVDALPDPMAEAAAYYAAIVQAPIDLEPHSLIMVPCPVCGAAPGEVCRDVGLGQIHLTRLVGAPVEYDSVQRPMSVRHVSLNADGSFTMAYEEGAMDPVKPAPGTLCPGCQERMRIAGERGMVGIALCGPCSEMRAAEAAAETAKPAPHPAPWRWDASPGFATTALLDAVGDPVLKAFANPLVPLLAFVRVEPAARAVIEAAGEMEALLRHVAAEVLPMEYGRPDGKPGGIAEAAQEIVDRIDAAKPTP